MANEIETKILDIDAQEIKKKLLNLGAVEKLATRLIVDWFRPVGTKEGEDPWFLRIRADSTGKSEVTWKAISNIQGTTRKHKEINFVIPEPEKLADLFTELGLEPYAHQEKDRTTLTCQAWQFDLDQYPGMPAFLEIEGQSEKHVNEAIKLLALENNKTWPQGERLLIQNIYGLNWYQMRF